MRFAALADVAELNPRLVDKVSAAEAVAFVPMALVSAETASTEGVGLRPYGEVAKGYTAMRDGDVLVAKITPCFENGKIAIAALPTEVGFGSTEFHVVRARAEVAEPRYLLHFLRQPRIRAEGERRMTGSGGQRRVPAGFLAELAVPLPPLPEQRRIADLLDRAETLRAQRRQALAQLDALAEAIFLEMFGEPRANPMGWPRLALGELIISGPQNGLYKPSTDYGSGTPILRIDAFYDGVVTKLATLKRVRVTDTERQTFALSPDDIVINRVNSPEYLGKSALIPPLDEPVVFESNMMRLGLDLQRTVPGYIVQFLQSEFIKSQIRSASKDAVNQSSINQQDVKAFQINLPPLELQRAFVRRIAQLNALKAHHRQSQTELDVLFASLQHSAFRGEL